MKSRNTFITMIIIIAILVLGVGYAAINGVQLFVNGSANIKANADFTVEYDVDHTVGLSTENKIDWEGNEVAIVSGEYTDAQNATITAYLDANNRSAYAIFKIINKSQELKATLESNITSQISGVPSEYLNITQTLYTNESCANGTELAEDVALAPGEAAYLKVQIDLKKLPVQDISKATFTITVDATPVDSNNL